MPKTTKKTTKVTSKKVKRTEVEMESPVVAKNQTGSSEKYPIALVAALITLIMLGYGYYRFWSIASVNGKSISRIEYYQMMEKQIGKQTLDNLVTESLILDAATKKGVTIEQAVIDKEIADIETRIKDQGQTLDEALTAEGMTRSDLEKQMRIQKFVETLSASDSAVTDAQIADFITNNKAQLPSTATPEELNNLAKTQLEKQAQSQNIQTWLTDLKANANIVYR
jgi:parvulin-like peptidyl-prolyl isomerase